MSRDIDTFRRDLAEFGTRLEAKVAEFREQGVLHGAARQKAAELQIEHARISRAAASGHLTVAGAITQELATDTKILNHTFDRWVAQIDRESER
jgi:hypothetical protein